MKVTVEHNSQKVLEALDTLFSRVDDPVPLLQAIGEELEDSTKQRFQDAKDPDGNQWVANTQTTLDFYFRKMGNRAAQAKKPLTGESRDLQTTITYQVQGDQLLIGSPLPYAAMQHFGGTTAANSMIPGKTITARPFLGISSDDEDEILEIVSDYLAI